MSSEVTRREPAHYRYNGKTARDRLAEGEAMLRDKALGMRQSDLMEKYGYSKDTVSKRLKDAVDARIATTVDAYREQVNDTIDMMLTKHAETIQTAEAMIALGASRQDVGLVERGESLRLLAMKGMNGVLDRRAKLNGLDAPVQVEAVVARVTEQEEQMAAAIRAAKAQQSTQSTQSMHADDSTSMHEGRNTGSVTQVEETDNTFYDNGDAA